jgi:hypothetical protein
VPNQLASEGDRTRFAGAKAWGSTVPSHGAKIAASAMSSRRTPPRRIIGCLLAKVATQPERRGDATMGGRSAAADSTKGASARGSDATLNI